MNKKALLVLSIGLLSMTLAACGNKPINSSIEQSSIDYGPSQTCSGMTTPPSSSLEPSSEITFSSVVSSSDISVPSSSAAPSSSVAPVSSSEAQSSSLAPSSSSTPISSSEATISSSEAPSSSEEPPVEEPINVVVNMPSYTDSSKTYDLTFTYHSSMFDHDQNTFSKDLALLAFGNAVANQNDDMIHKFYEDLDCDLIYEYNYNETPSKDTIAYAFAHKKMHERDLVFVSVRGFNYGREWEDNFNLGGEFEHHAGFMEKAGRIYQSLDEYIFSLLSSNVVLFVNGYSRGGGVANLLANKINQNIMGVNTNVSALYAYTFEAPKGVFLYNNDPADNVFNLVSSGDLVTHFVPEQYSFTRYGQDIDIYSENLNQLVEEFDSDLELPPFVATDYYANEEQLINYLIEGVISYDQSDDTQPREAKTREQFMDNYADAFGYMLGLFFCLKGETTASIKEGLAALSNDFMAMAGLMYYENGLYNFLKPYIDEDGIEYDDDSFKESCNVLIEFLKGPGTRALALLIDTNKTLDRMLMLHTPEVNYALLNAFQIEE